jgi:hypothetical protein
MIQAGFFILTQNTDKNQQFHPMSKTIAFVCRVVVMMTFLIAIPLIALFGKDLPAVAETVWDWWQKPEPEQNAWADAGEAPPFSPTGTTPETPRYNDPQTPLNTNPPSTVIADQTPTATPADPYRQSNAFPYLRPNMASNEPAHNSGTPINSGPVTTPSAPPYASRPIDPSQTMSPITQPASQKQTFEKIGDRLKQLGVTDYRLESWGNGGKLFRFECRVALDRAGNLTQQFEATHTDPVQAMLTVLYKIESWRKTPSPAPAPQPNHLNTLR